MSANIVDASSLPSRSLNEFDHNRIERLTRDVRSSILRDRCIPSEATG